MKPKRIALTHELIVGYGIYKDLNVYVEINFIWIFYEIKSLSLHSFIYNKFFKKKTKISIIYLISSNLFVKLKIKNLKTLKI